MICFRHQVLASYSDQNILRINVCSTQSLAIPDSKTHGACSLFMQVLSSFCGGLLAKVSDNPAVIMAAKGDRSESDVQRGQTM